MKKYFFLKRVMETVKLSVELFVEKPSLDLICGICYEVLDDPSQCKNGHLLCLECFQKSIRQNPRCPICLTEMSGDDICKNLFVKNAISCLFVKCHSTKLKEGERDFCRWTGPLSTLSDHRDDCLFQMDSDCPIFLAGGCLKGCLNSYSYCDMIRHLTEYSTYSKKVIIKLNNELDSAKKKPFICPNDSYCGESVLGKRSGLGFMKTNLYQATLAKYEKTYVGSWLNGMRHGSGIYTTFHGKYSGEFFEDEMHGECLEYLTSDGNRCSGTFRHNVMHGFGKKTKGNSKWCYEGDWINDKRHGNGTFTFACGTEVYVGEFVTNSMKGEGILTTANKDTFTGTFRLGRCNGKAVWRNASGMVLYDGFFLNHRKHGHGVEYALDGTYTGNFKCGLRSGIGILKCVNGDVYEGMFEKNCFVGVVV
jgi:hypothetical protein